MKKIIIIIFITYLVINNSFAYEYNINGSDILIINKLNSKIELILKEGNKNIITEIENKLTTLQAKNKDNKKLFYIINEVKKYIVTKKNKKIINEIYSDNSKENMIKYNINNEKIKNIWLNWHNKTRIENGKNIYSYDDGLNHSAYEWSLVQSERGIMSHNRDESDTYYNYKKIENWLSDKGVICDVVGGVTYSESIGKYGYYCYDSDCSDEMIDSLKKIYDFYINEKGLKYPENAHYLAIINTYYSKIGLGISIKETNEKKYFEFYVTTHYCTKLNN